MSIIHGSKGLIYFVHQFKPTFDEHALLDDPEMLASVTKLNKLIAKLAPVIKGPSVTGVTTVTSTSAGIPIDTMTKRVNSDTYVFAVGMRNGPTKGQFSIAGIGKNRVAEVIGENRTISFKGGIFTDDFKPYEPHIYRISTTQK